MITGKLKSDIDKLWLEFHQGGITNPLTVIEQISFLMYLRLLDSAERREELKAKRSKGKTETRLLFGADNQNLRWHRFRELPGEQMLPLVRDRVFAFMREVVAEQTTVGHFMHNAQCLIPTGSLMAKAVELIDDLPLEVNDTKGDIYEYMLGKLSTAGIAGQFRTPRHIIRAMVEMVDPKPDDRICDPACGTAGFLSVAMDYLKEVYTSPEMVDDATEEDGTPILDRRGKPVKTYHGDLLTPYRDHIQQGLLTGFDFDQTMIRIAAMNLLLHGITSPGIEQINTLSQAFVESNPQHASDAFSLILANPPFKGAVDENVIHASLTKHVKTKKTELLFLVLMLRMLTEGGRCAVIVPDGVLFGSSKAHTAVRKLLIEDHGLEAVVSLPSGVFRLDGCSQ